MFTVTDTEKENLLKLPLGQSDYNLAVQIISNNTLSLDSSLYKMLENEAKSLIEQLIHDSERMSFIASNTPDDLLLGGNLGQPNFFTLDFALTNDSDFPFRLIELQGFPTILSLIEQVSRVVHSSPVRDEVSLKSLMSDELPVEEIVMLDIDPENQLSSIDFKITKKTLGIEYLCINDVLEKEGRFYYQNEEDLIEIRQVYNRLITPELNQQQKSLLVRMTHSERIKWVAHPDWFVLISKSSLPLLKGPSILRSKVYDSKQRLPCDSVIKPIWDFGGTGVKLNTSGNEEALENHLEQEKASYRQVTLNCGNQVYFELRVSLVLHEGKDTPELHSIAARSVNELPIGMSRALGFDHTGFSIILQK